MPRRPIVTLLTDFGLADPYVAEMKGVILSIQPLAAMVDITHQIPPGDVLAGAVALRQALPYFPEGTVHCAVVDPGVGTERRILAARYAGQAIVAPDNGLISFVEQDQPLSEIVVVRNDRYFLPGPTSATFHGRDIMAPVAAAIAGGLDLTKLGPPPEKFKLLDLPQPRSEDGGVVVGQIIYVDRFGNLISNVPAVLLEQSLGDRVAAVVSCAGRDVGAIQATYDFGEAGQPLALINSMSLLEVAVKGGKASDVLGAGVGAEVRVGPRTEQGG